MSRDLIETHVFGWLGGCAPGSYTDEQMEEFDQLMEPWLEDYERKRSAGGGAFVWPLARLDEGAG